MHCSICDYCPDLDGGDRPYMVVDAQGYCMCGTCLEVVRDTLNPPPQNIFEEIEQLKLYESLEDFLEASGETPVEAPRKAAEGGSKDLARGNATPVYWPSPVKLEANVNEPIKSSEVEVTLSE